MTRMAAFGTGLTLAGLLHCWNERAFAPTSATTQFDSEVILHASFLQRS
jgi:hypothetical protein